MSGVWSEISATESSQITSCRNSILLFGIALPYSVDLPENVQLIFVSNIDDLESLRLRCSKDSESGGESAAAGGGRALSLRQLSSFLPSFLTIHSFHPNGAARSDSRFAVAAAARGAKRRSYQTLFSPGEVAATKAVEAPSYDSLSPSNL